MHDRHTGPWLWNGLDARCEISWAAETVARGLGERCQTDGESVRDVLEDMEEESCKANS